MSHVIMISNIPAVYMVIFVAWCDQRLYMADWDIKRYQGQSPFTWKCDEIMFDKIDNYYITFMKS